jgi:ribonuclease R
MRDKVGEEFDATIVGFSPKKVFFETNEYVEGFWDVVSEKNFYEFNDKTYQMRDLDTGRVFQLGDKMKVIIARADLDTLEIEMVPDLTLEEKGEEKEDGISQQ